MKEAIDSRFQERIPGHHPVLSWLPRHAAASVVRYTVGKDGMAAHERWTGKTFKREVAEFGECVWFLQPRSRGATGMVGRWSEGIWLGTREESGEVMIGTKDGIMKARTVRRKASHVQLCNRTKLDEVTATRGMWVGTTNAMMTYILRFQDRKKTSRRSPQRTRKTGPK